MNEIYPYFCMLLKCLYEAINKTVCEKNIVKISVHFYLGGVRRYFCKKKLNHVNMHSM